MFYIRNSDDQDLLHAGVLPGASLTVSDSIKETGISMAPVISSKKYEEDKTNADLEDREIALLGDEEEQMLRKAIEASLKDMGGIRAESYNYLEEEKKVVRPRDRSDVPPIQIRGAETEPEEPEKPKTPSTGNAFLMSMNPNKSGESTPTRRFRLQQQLQQQLQSQPNNYQLLSNFIAGQIVHQVELKREFEQKFEQAELARTGPRLKIKQKSRATILQALLKLEEEEHMAAGGDQESKKKGALHKHSKKRAAIKK